MARGGAVSHVRDVPHPVFPQPTYHPLPPRATMPAGPILMTAPGDPAEYKTIVLRVNVGDRTLEFQRAWPFTHPPSEGDHVSVPCIGWDGPDRRAIRKVYWQPSAGLVGGTLFVELFTQRPVGEPMTAPAAAAFFTEKGWSYCGLVDS